jgi:hypothetical protein
MLPKISFMLCIAILAFYISQTSSELIEFEAEDGSYTGSINDRSAASGKATVYLTASQTVTHTFSTRSSCSVEIHDVAYTNDGGSDVIEVQIDGIRIGSFNTIAASNFGMNWNVIRNTGMIGENRKINSGSHQLQLKAVNTDSYGVELDKSILNLTCTARIQPSPMCTNISLLTGALNCNNPPYATRNSSDTSCAEEDNVNIPIFYSGVQSFKVTAHLPEYYPSITTMNNRKENFKNCEFASQNIWKIGVNDNIHSEFAALCASNVYYIGESISTFCHEINNKYNNTKYKIYFTAKGISSGLVEASIGSVLTVKFTQVTGHLVLEVRCFGRNKKWLSLGNATFNSGELTKMWQVPDLTWSEGQNSNQIELQVANGSSINASGKFDYIKLDKRDERGESSPITVFNNGETIIEAITIDFWWLYPKGMIIKNLHDNQEWHNITYFRIYRKIPGTNNFSQLFVLYQDGNSRILPFPPDGIDWIPFGSSVIIGPTTNPIRPYASIIRVNINAYSLTMELHYESGGKATATLQYTTTSTTIHVDDISYTTTPPFTTFRPMWVADGNADVDRVQTSRNSWHIQYGWQSISASSFKFFRSCVSTHNTLSPDILIAVSCKTAETTSQASESRFSNKSTAFIWTIIAISVLFNCYTS